MNYRHGFHHAGNFADVLKHVALCELLRLLTARTKLFVLDTHTGAGGYDLGGDLARRTGRPWAASAASLRRRGAGMPALR